jgi:hypothetical protein
LAVYALATGAGTIQERLLDGWRSQGMLALPMGPGKAGVPMSPELVERLLAFNARLSSREDPDGVGTLESTIRAFSDREAADAAKELREMRDLIRLELEDAREQRKYQQRNG